MLLDDAIKIRAARKLTEESENIVLRPAAAAQLMNGDSNTNPMLKPKPKLRKPRKTRAKKGK